MSRSLECGLIIAQEVSSVRRRYVTTPQLLESRYGSYIRIPSSEYTRNCRQNYRYDYRYGVDAQRPLSRFKQFIKIAEDYLKQPNDSNLTFKQFNWALDTLFQERTKLKALGIDIGQYKGRYRKVLNCLKPLNQIFF